MGKPSDHIVPGSLCIVCNKLPATVLTRLVARDDGMLSDGMLWAGGTCWGCVKELAITLNGKVPRSTKLGTRLFHAEVRLPRLGLSPLAIVDDRTFEQKLRDGDVSLAPDEVYCDVCTWPKRLCVCAGSNRGRKS
jgi:hypothetical protein